VPFRDVLLLLVFVVSLPVCFVRPFYGIILWTIVAFLNPQSYIWGAVTFPWAMAVAIPTLAGMLIFSRGWMERLMSRELLMLGTLWVWFTITTVVSTNTTLFSHHASDTWLRWIFVSKILLMTAGTAAIVDSLFKFRVLMITIAGCFGVFILKALPFLAATGGAFRLYGPPNSMVEDNNDFGLALNMTLPIFFFLAQTEPNRWVKRLFAFCFAATIPSILFTYSRGALIGLVVVLGLMLLRSKQRVLLGLMVIIAMLVGLTFAPERWRERMDPNQGLDGSALSRINSWTFAWNLASDYPVTGGGFATFSPDLFGRYAPNGADVKGPHSVYFQILAEHGFVGEFLYLSLVVICFLALWRLSRQAKEIGDTRVIAYANMLSLSMVGFLASGTFLGRAYFDYFFTLVACVAILQRSARQEWAADAEVLDEGLDTADDRVLAYEQEAVG